MRRTVFRITACLTPRARPAAAHAGCSRATAGGPLACPGVTTASLAAPRSSRDRRSTPGSTPHASGGVASRPPSSTNTVCRDASATSPRRLSRIASSSPAAFASANACSYVARRVVLWSRNGSPGSSRSAATPYPHHAFRRHDALVADRDCPVSRQHHPHPPVASRCIPPCRPNSQELRHRFLVKRELERPRRPRHPREVPIEPHEPRRSRPPERLNQAIFYREIRQHAGLQHRLFVFRIRIRFRDDPPRRPRSARFRPRRAPPSGSRR